jgi:hypothetical protein
VSPLNEQIANFMESLNAEKISEKILGNHGHRTPASLSFSELEPVWANARSKRASAAIDAPGNVPTGVAIAPA